jgi:ABC-type glycerol-3-phosphate transport system substrate-binding protein
MKTNRVVATLVAALSLSLLAGCGGTEADLTSSTAQALDLTPCFGLITTLENETLVVQFTSAKDQTFAIGKLDAATQKLQLGKTADAVQKLGDYSTKIQQLVAGGKIAPSLDGTVTPQTLLDGAATAIACIQPPTP